MSETFFKAIEALQEKIGNWFIDFFVGIPSFIAAILIFILFIFIAKILKKIVKRILTKFIGTSSLIAVASNLVSIAVYTIGFLIALSVMNLDTTVKSLLAGAGILGLVIGLAFQDTIANIFGGVIIALRKPFDIGDLIQTRDIFGEVRQLRLRVVELHNRNGQLVYIPSKDVIANPIYNFTKMGIRRIVIKVGIEYSANLKKVEEVTLKALKELPFALQNHPIEFFYEEFGDSSINFIARFWINYTRQRDYRYAVSKAIMAIKESYDENNITIPFPIRTLEFNENNFLKQNPQN